MKVTDICKSYFSGFQEVSNFKNNDNETNALATLKILSYFTIVTPLSFAAVYGAASLYRINKKQHHSTTDANVNNQAKKTLIIDISTSKVNSPTDSSELPK